MWLESCLKSYHVSPFAASAKRSVRGVWWGDHEQLEVFSSNLVSLIEMGDLSVTQTLLSVAGEQFHSHTKSWMKDKSATYRRWLTQASHKGLRGLFRSVKAEEAVHLIGHSWKCHCRSAFICVGDNGLTSGPLRAGWMQTFLQTSRQRLWRRRNL